MVYKQNSPHAPRPRLVVLMDIMTQTKGRRTLKGHYSTNKVCVAVWVKGAESIDGSAAAAPHIEGNRKLN